MKIFSLLFILAFSLTTVFAQKADVEVYEKKDGDKVIIVARNTGQSDYNVKVTITSEGMDVLPSSVVEAKVPAGYMKEMATITPRAGMTWTYGYDVTMTQLLTKSTVKTDASKPTAPTTQKTTTTANPTPPKQAAPASALSDAKIILYSKPGCGRCTIAKNQLTSLGIKFDEVNTQSGSPEVNNMWSQLRNQGFTGGSVTMPVIRVDGKYHYDINNLQDFVAKLKS